MSPRMSPPIGLATGVGNSRVTLICSPGGARPPPAKLSPQGGVVSPLLSNILLTPFDQEMRRKGYQVTRYADDWVVTCESAAEARAAVAAALRILNELGV